MRLGVVTTSYPRELGEASGSFVQGLNRWLMAQGHTLDVVAASAAAGRGCEGWVAEKCGTRAVAAGGSELSQVGAVTETLRWVPGMGLFGGTGAPERLEQPMGWARAAGFAALQLGAVMHAARRGRWDGVISHWVAPSGIAVAVGAGPRPHVAVAHSGDVHVLARTGLADAAVSALSRRPGTRVVFVAEHLRQRLLACVTARHAEWLAGHSRVAPMGLSLEQWTCVRSLDAAEARARWGIPPDAFVVGALGRLVPIKGFDVLVRAMSAVPQAWLVLGGDGPEREALMALAGPRVRFLGAVAGGERDALFAGASVLAIPSVPRPDGRVEGAPLVAAEAWAAGVPVVASDMEGLRETCAPGTRFVSPGDVAALGADLTDLARCRPARPSLPTHLSWDVVGPAFVP